MKVNLCNQCLEFITKNFGIKYLDNPGENFNEDKLRCDCCCRLYDTFQVNNICLRIEKGNKI